MLPELVRIVLTGGYLQEGQERIEPHAPPPREPELLQEFRSPDITALDRSVEGWTRVRERDRVPARLDLQADLGADAMRGIHLEYADEGERIRRLGELDLPRISGRGSFGEDLHYDEGNFRAGHPIELEGTLLFLRATIPLKDVFSAAAPPG